MWPFSVSDGLIAVKRASFCPVRAVQARAPASTKFSLATQRSAWPPCGSGEAP